MGTMRWTVCGSALLSIVVLLVMVIGFINVQWVVDPVCDELASIDIFFY